MTHDRRFTQTELQIILSVLASLEGELAMGLASDGLARRIARVFPDATFDIDLGKYADYGDRVPPSKDSDGGRAELGLARLVQRLHFVMGGVGGPEELAQPIE